MICIRFTTLFAERIGGITSVDLPATTVRAALQALTDRHPELSTLVWARDRAVNPVMVLFLNDRQLNADEIDASVSAGDQIDIIPALEGG